MVAARRRRGCERRPPPGPPGSAQFAACRKACRDSAPQPTRNALNLQDSLQAPPWPAHCRRTIANDACGSSPVPSVPSITPDPSTAAALSSASRVQTPTLSQDNPQPFAALLDSSVSAPVAAPPPVANQTQTPPPAGQQPQTPSSGSTGNAGNSNAPASVTTTSAAKQPAPSSSAAKQPAPSPSGTPSSPTAKPAPANASSTKPAPTATANNSGAASPD